MTFDARNSVGDLKPLEDVLTRLSLDLATSSSMQASLSALTAVQRSLLLTPWSSRQELALASLSDFSVAAFPQSLSEPPVVESECPANLELPISSAELFSEVLVECVRNWKAHGNESRAARKYAGKPEIPRVKVGFRLTDSGLTLQFHDDGPGVSPRLLLERAHASGALHRDGYLELQRQFSQGRLEGIYELLLKDGVSSSPTADLTAGRGVGLARLAERVRRESGGVQAGVSELLGGFRLTVDVPLALVGLSVSREPAEEKSSASISRLVQVRSGSAMPRLSETEFRIFHRLPLEAKGWSNAHFSRPGVSWISIAASEPSGESGGLRVIGLNLDAALI